MCNYKWHNFTWYTLYLLNHTMYLYANVSHAVCRLFMEICQQSPSSDSIIEFSDDGSWKPAPETSSEWYTIVLIYMRISTNHSSLGCEQPSRPRCRTITHCAGCVSANARPLQLCWGDRECGCLTAQYTVHVHVHIYVLVQCIPVMHCPVNLHGNDIVLCLSWCFALLLILVRTLDRVSLCMCVYT